MTGALRADSGVGFSVVRAGTIQAMRMAIMAAATLLGAGAALGGEAEAASGYKALTTLFADWRRFEPPATRDCAPDYSAAAMAEKAAGLVGFQKRLAAIDTKGWKTPARVDYEIVRAEMNGLDFNLRVLRPFARDPSFYANVFGEDSDVPEHEGPAFHPPIDLQRYRYPLSAADQAELTCLLGAIPQILEDAKANLAGSTASDLWRYGGRAFREQTATLEAFAAGRLDMRTLKGTVKADMTGAGAPLLAAIEKARAASESFRAYVEAEAPKRNGPSGVGRENYDWYMANVHLSAYGWEDQVRFLRRELERARAALVLEEHRNRALPPQDPVDDAGAYMTMARARMSRLVDFLVREDLIEDAGWNRAAMAAQIGGPTPPEARNFFSHGAARDPAPLYTHFYHWIELARREETPHKSPIRAATPLYDMYDGRSEGIATAVEEMLMHAGLYDDAPRTREIVWIMLANRAARGLASLYVQANEMSLEEAGRFHALWTPRGWADATSDLVVFEQLLYLRQPGYGTSYVTGKLELDRLFSQYAYDRERAGETATFPDFLRAMNASGIIPFPLIEQEMIDPATRAMLRR